MKLDKQDVQQYQTNETFNIRHRYASSAIESNLLRHMQRRGIFE